MTCPICHGCIGDAEAAAVHYARHHAGAFDNVNPEHARAKRHRKH